MVWRPRQNIEECIFLEARPGEDSAQAAQACRRLRPKSLARKCSRNFPTQAYNAVAKC